ncbi:SWIM zinc finger family protein [Paenibacillus sacheonensis]|uniref:SWIM-type domain-containing protein n=1 Tax=Paenibacillus sacheonensis TaxID=742054 RepID=A0A7X4YSV2_9BACL|nr:hypothetical protein [Paenibacillus sacheonensis]MBM7567161.1 hypothetical protein [Paenibacillus sacheonensis]NBC70914.1 hypothetical protein [Paenibacillus sacheonensis]
METDYSLDDAGWRSLLEGVAAHFDELTIIRGFQYYKQGRVESLAPREDGQLLDASVQDNRLCHISVDLGDLGRSACSCPLDRTCHHIVAALLRYAEMCGRPIQALVNARMTVRGMNQASQQGAQTSAAKTAAAVAAKSAERQARMSAPAQRPSRPTLTEQELTELPVAEWHERFRLRRGPLQMTIRTAQEVTDLMADLQAMRPELPYALEQLFQLHAILFVLEQMVKPAQADWRQSGLFMGYHTQLALDGLLMQARRLLSDELAISSEDSAYWSRLLDTADWLRDRMLTEDKTLNGFAPLYRAFWLNWLGPRSVGSKPMYEEELRKLQAARQELGASLSLLNWTLAQCLLWIYLARDGEAFSLLAEGGNKLMVKAEHLMPLLDVMNRAEQWERLRDWLAKTGPLLVGFRGEDLAPYGDCWSVVVEQLPEALPAMWRTLTSMLPFSRVIYEEALVAHGEWARWIDYQMCGDNEPLSFRVSVLKPIEKEAPELLLPFYHQAVERYVLQKNRDGYRAAVKLLKRLAKLYVRLKREERWEQFFSAFASRNSRLRALQEELRKGGLLA